MSDQRMTELVAAWMVDMAVHFREELAAAIATAEREDDVVKLDPEFVAPCLLDLVDQALAELRRAAGDELKARAWTAARLKSAREQSGCSVAQWAARLSVALDYPVYPALVEAWESPTGPKPPAAWATIVLGAGPELQVSA